MVGKQQRAEAVKLTVAEQDVVAKNLGLVQWTIGRFFGGMKQADYDDAWQDGVVGLCRAAQKFDPGRGIRFATYAPFWIRQAIERGRGDFEGVSFRTAMNTGRIGDYRPPISLEYQRGFDGGDRMADAGQSTIGADLEDPGELFEERVCLRDLIERVGDACQDEVDRSIIEAGRVMVDVAACHRDVAVAERHGLSSEAIRRRRLKLAARARGVAA